MNPVCPNCRRPLASDDVNVAKDSAFCRSCSRAFKFSDLLHDPTNDPEINLSDPPPGVTFEPQGEDVVIQFSHRSIGSGIFLLFFGLFWNGVVSVFVTIALAGTLALFGISPPGWLPDSILENKPAGIGVLIFVWLFLTPFLLVGIFLVIATLLSFGGRTEIRIGGGRGIIFTGLGKIGWRRKFNPVEVTGVRIEDRRWRDSDGDRRRNTWIALERGQGKPVKLGSGLDEKKMKFVALALKGVLLRN